MAETYREKITALIGLLQQPDGLLEAKETLRGLIDRITLKAPEPGAKLAIHLEGALAELLMLSMETKLQTGAMTESGVWAV
ncbi:hypothetical protein ACEN2J_13190 [Pseudorhodobacter sp. W20_MBD10_FR17]|uniref:hypothetical protein n=1 Tax=Pseudorhodobacter sp. W20_MBD10_FR17 TaxID=3240266 RepID=UPI003F99DA3D